MNCLQKNLFLKQKKKTKANITPKGKEVEKCEKWRVWTLWQSPGCPLALSFHLFCVRLVYTSVGLLQLDFILWLIYLEWSGLEDVPTPRPKFSDLHILLPLLLGVDHEDDINAFEKELFSLNLRATTGYNPMCPWTLHDKKI